MGLTNREYIGRALDIMASGLEPYIRETIAELAPGIEWTRILEHKDDQGNRDLSRYKATDPQVQLRMLTERLGNLDYPFSLAPETRAYASEMRQVRNLWAHNEPFTDDDVFRYLDTTARLLHAIGAEIATDEARVILQEVRHRSQVAQQPEPASSEPEHVIAPLPHSMPERAEGNDSRQVLASQIDLSFEASAEVSYAMAYNGRRIVSRLTITNHGPELRGVVLHLDVTGESGTVSRPSGHYLDLPANKPVTITDPNLQADPAVMLQLQDRQHGAVRARLLLEDAVVAIETAEIDLLAAHHWVGRPGLLSLESLAAFVQPNHPEIAKLCSQASDLLKTSTGSGSLQGYQSGPDRADAIAEAIFTAMKQRGIRYSEPPASWGQHAQRVRTAEEVLDGRFGTCLDTAVVLAAALEFAGLQANLWLVEGHIFLGYWRDEANFRTPALEEPALLVNAIDMGRIRLIETTKVADTADFSMDELHDGPYARYLTGDMEEVRGVVDIFAARYAGVRPIPARFTSDDGGVAVVEYTPVRRDVPHAVPASGAESTGGRNQQRQDMPARVSQWKNTLLDLSLRNRLINFTKTARFPLAVPDARTGQFEDMINGGDAITLLPSDDVSAMQADRGIRFGRDLPQDRLSDLLINQKSVFADVTTDTYQTRMRNLAYKARTLVDETGANNLYLALGSLVWTLDGRELRSPLVLVPARLRPTTKQGAYKISLDDSGTSTPNYCLLEKLRLTHGLEIPGMSEPLEDGSGIDLDAAFGAVRAALAENELPFRVEPTVDLSILQFAKFRLWKDLDENWESLSNNALVKHLVYTPTESFIDPVSSNADTDMDELAAKVPIPADSSQLQAIAEAVNARTFVLEGPPGTGKSQTITNLLTRAIAEGKRVLFVAEKRAALDVVQKRLVDVGMGVFSLDLHDKGSKPAAVRAQIKAALDHTVDPDRQGLDAALGDLDKARRSLVRYASRLHDENGAELSLYSARTKELAVGEEVRPLQVPDTFAETATMDQLQQLRGLFAELPDTAEPAGPTERHPWGFIDASLSSAQESVAASAAARLQSTLDGLTASTELSAVLQAARTPADLMKLAAFLRPKNVDIDVLDEVRTNRWADATRTLGAQMTAFMAASHPELDKVTPEALDLPIADIHAQAVAAAESGFFGRKKRLAAVSDQLTAVTRPDAEIKPKKLPELTAALVTLQGTVRRLAGGAASIPGIELPISWNPLTEAGQQYLRNNVQWLEWAASLVKVEGDPHVAEFLPTLRAFLRGRPSVDMASVEAVATLAQAATDLFAAARLTDEGLDAWCGGKSLIVRWEHTARGRDPHKAGAPSLRRWLAFIGQLEPLHDAGLSQARDQLKLGQVNADDASPAFERGLALASQQERAVATGLDRFEPRSHEKMIGRFTGRSSRVREHLKTALPDDVLKSRRFDVNSKAGQMGLLQRQLNYKSGGLRVRPLLEKYGELITQILPCVLVSPDSVARFFPAKAELFDLVVFDEASQIRVADAVGAMGRGRAVVVVGDSKQMPPASFAETSTDKDEDTELANETVEDEESILSECVLARVPRQWLSWHYRSQDESLIAFSNQQYYDNKLSSFPAPVHGAASAAANGYGINFIRVDGNFNRSGAGKLLRTNPVEAEAVVANIRRRFDDSPKGYPSVGVVTFNLQQRAYIESLLRDSDDPRIADALDATDGLFVKNLENVQGDERDTILFSTGFSKNDRGYLPLNFGPLNRSGGERRLNVAITRARRQVIVFSSFDPSELRAEETSSVGIKHLRSYLELAANGTRSLPYDGRRKPAIDRHREQIADALRDRGMVVTTDVGLSDFKVDLSVALSENPNRPVMAVLLDSPAWASRGTVGDRDGLPTEVLSRMLRWPAVERVWLPEWLADAETVVERLEKAARREDSDFVEELRASHDDADPLLQEPAPSVERDTDGFGRNPGGELRDARAFDDEPSSLDEEYAPVRSRSSASIAVDEKVTEYVPWAARRVGGIEVLDTLTVSPKSRALVASIMGEIIEAEGPIHIERLAKLVCAEFCLNKVNAQRAKSVLRLLDVNQFSLDADSFVWPTVLEAADWQGYRQNGPEMDRKIEHVSKTEIANAMVDVCQAAAGFGMEDLKRHTVRIFGGKRVTTGISARLESALAEALRLDKLRTDDSGLIRAA